MVVAGTVDIHAHQIRIPAPTKYGQHPQLGSATDVHYARVLQTADLQ